MRCQHVDDDIRCRFDATRRVLVASGDPPDPDQAGFGGPSTWSGSASSMTPTLGGRCRCLGLPVPCQSATAPIASSGRAGHRARLRHGNLTGARRRE